MSSPRKHCDPEMPTMLLVLASMTSAGAQESGSAHLPSTPHAPGKEYVDVQELLKISGTGSKQ